MRKTLWATVILAMTAGVCLNSCNTAAEKISGFTWSNRPMVLAGYTWSNRSRMSAGYTWSDIDHRGGRRHA